MLKAMEYGSASVCVCCLFLRGAEMRTLLRQTRFVAFLVAAVCTFVRNVPVGYVTTHALVTSMLAA